MAAIMYSNKIEGISTFQIKMCMSCIHVHSYMARIECIPGSCCLVYNITKQYQV